MASYFDDGWYSGIDVEISEVETGSEGALVKQRVLIELDLSTGIPLIQTHCAVLEIYDFSQHKLRSLRGKRKREWGSEGKR